MLDSLTPPESRQSSDSSGRISMLGAPTATYDQETDFLATTIDGVGRLARGLSRSGCRRMDPGRGSVTASGPADSEVTFSAVPGSCLTSAHFGEAAAAKLIVLGETSEFMFGDCSWVASILSAPDTVGDVSITIEATG